MFKRLNTTAAGATTTLLTLACFVLLSGCGDMSRSPLVSSPDVTAPEGGGASLVNGRPSLASDDVAATIVLSPRALRAAKKANDSGKVTATAEAGVYTESVSARVSPYRQKKMEVQFGEYGGADIVRVKKVSFTVKRNSIIGNEALQNHRDGSYAITMEVSSGTTLADVLVKFGPSGLKFSPPAQLDIFLEGELDPAEVAAYHIDGTAGTITKIGMEIDDQGRTGWKITIDVPGFSRYDLGGNESEDPDGYW